MSSTYKNGRHRDHFERLEQLSKYVWLVNSTGRLCSAPHCTHPVAIMRLSRPLDSLGRGWCALHVPDYIARVDQ